MIGFGRRVVPGLARARETRDMSQACLAQAAGVSVRTVRRAEAGHAVSPETRMALKAVLGEALADVREGTRRRRPELGLWGAGVLGGALGCAAVMTQDAGPRLPTSPDVRATTATSAKPSGTHSWADERAVFPPSPVARGTSDKVGDGADVDVVFASFEVEPDKVPLVEAVLDAGMRDFREHDPDPDLLRHVAMLSETHRVDDALHATATFGTPVVLSKGGDDGRHDALRMVVVPKGRGALHSELTKREDDGSVSTSVGFDGYWGQSYGFSVRSEDPKRRTVRFEVVSVSVGDRADLEAVSHGRTGARFVACSDGKATYRRLNDGTTFEADDEVTRAVCGRSL